MYVPKTYRDIRGGEWIETPPYDDDPDPEYSAHIGAALDAIAEFAREFDGEIAAIYVSTNSDDSDSAGDSDDEEDCFPFYDTDSEEVPF